MSPAVPVGRPESAPDDRLQTSCRCFVCADTTVGTAPLFNFQVGQVLGLNLSAGSTSHDWARKLRVALDRRQRGQT